MNGHEMNKNENLKNSTWPIKKFVAQLQNQRTARQFVQSFENLAQAWYSHRVTTPQTSKAVDE